MTLADGRTIAPSEVLGSERAGRTIVYSGDTKPDDVLRAVAENADVLVHEATFATEEAARAAETGHSTAAGGSNVA